MFVRFSFRHESNNFNFKLNLKFIKNYENYERQCILELIDSNRKLLKFDNSEVRALDFF